MLNICLSSLQHSFWRYFLSFALVLTELFVSPIAYHLTLTPSFGHKRARSLQPASDLSHSLPVLPHCFVVYLFHRTRVKSSFVWLENFIISWRVCLDLLSPEAIPNTKLDGSRRI